MRLNQDLKLERDALSATEQVFEKNAGSEYNNIKQKILESMVEKTLLSAFPSAYVLKNIFVPKKSGGTTEIDVMMINNDGIFLFEAKNINATLKGDWSKNKIVAEYPNGSHIEIDNPVLQNSTHFTHVANLVSKTKPHLIKNIVVLGPDTKVVRPEFMTIPSYAAITTIPSLVYTVNRRAQVSRNILSNEEVKSISEIFETYLGYTDEKMEQHIQNIKH